MHLNEKSKRGQANRKKSSCRLQRPRLLQHAAIIKVVQMVILWVLATHYTPYARSITIIAQNQLSKGHKSGCCINTAMHRTHEKMVPTSYIKCHLSQGGSPQCKGNDGFIIKAYTIKNRGRCNKGLMQRGIKKASTVKGMDIPSSNTHV